MTSFEQIMDALPSLVFVKDARSRILYANRPFFDVFAPEKRQGILGTTACDDFTESQTALILAEDRRAFQLGQTEIVEEIVDFEGRRRVLRSRKIVFTTMAGEPRLLGVADDITDLSDRERHLAGLNSHLHALAAITAKGTVSPLSSCVSALGMIVLDQQTIFSARSQSYLERVMGTFKVLGENLEGLLSTAKSNTPNDADGFALCDLNITFEEVRLALSQEVESSGAQIFASRMPTIAVDGRLFKLLLHYLVLMGIENVGPGAVPFIVVRYELRDQQHVFSVEDNSETSSSLDVAKQFEFSPDEDAPTASGGLSLCKRIVDLHQGQIWFDRTWAKGRKTVWTLPQLDCTRVAVGSELPNAVRTAA